MQRREKILGLVFAAAILLWRGPAIVQALFLEPLARRGAQVRDLQKSVKTRQIRKLQLAQAEQRLESAVHRSLPPDPVKAATRYHAWLIDETAKTGLPGASIDVVKREPRLTADTYHEISASIVAQGTLSKLCDFLHAFQAAGLLHRVAKISIDNKSGPTGDPALNAIIDVDALSLPAAAPGESLTFGPDERPVPSRPLRERQAYAGIAARNLFVRGINGPVQPSLPPSADRSPAVGNRDAEQVKLVGIFHATGAALDRHDAELLDQASGTRTTLSPGAEFKVAGLSGRTLSIDVGFVVLEIQGARWRLDLGRPLGELVKLPAGEGGAQ